MATTETPPETPTSFSGENAKAILQAVMPYLVSGAGGAALGGMLTGRRRKRSGESRMGHLGRVMTNALLAGGLTGAAHYGLSKGFGNTVGAVDESGALTGSDLSQENPLTSTVKGLAFSPLTAAAAGGTGLWMTQGSELLGVNTQREEARKALKSLLPSGKKSTPWMATGAGGVPLKVTADSLLKLDAKQIGDLERRGLIPADLRRAAGLASDAGNLQMDSATGKMVAAKNPGLFGKVDGSSTRGALSNILRKGFSTLGQTHPQRIRRGALGLAAAGIPALLGALLTDKAE
jgi:hypothetical protein